MTRHEISPSRLWVVATPIGNLKDIAPRALEILQGVELLAVEDTRVTGKLLANFAITTPMQAYHEHNEQQQTPRLIDKLKAGHSIALLSDAGTPLVSDPGYRLVSAARREGIEVSTVPGPSAAIAALSISGLECHRFAFAGFPPSRSGQRKKWLASQLELESTLVLYESAKRVEGTLADLSELLPESHPVFICRELTKMYEQSLGATLHEVRQAVGNGTFRLQGEFVLIVAAVEPLATGNTGAFGRKLASSLAAELPPAKAAKIAAEISGESRKALYQWLQSSSSGV